MYPPCIAAAVHKYHACSSTAVGTPSSERPVTSRNRCSYLHSALERIDLTSGFDRPERRACVIAQSVSIFRRPRDACMHDNTHTTVSEFSLESNVCVQEKKPNHSEHKQTAVCTALSCAVRTAPQDFFGQYSRYTFPFCCSWVLRSPVPHTIPLTSLAA